MCITLFEVAIGSRISFSRITFGRIQIPRIEQFLGQKMMLIALHPNSGPSTSPFQGVYG